MRKTLILLIILAMASVCFGQRRVSKKELTFYDIFGDEETGLTSVTIYNAGTSTNATLYTSRTGSTALTNPITTGLSDGTIEFWSRDADYKFTVTDGTDSLTIDNMTGSQTRVPWWGSYLGSLSSYNLADADDLVFGTGSDWTMDSDTAGRLDAIPGADAGIFAIGDGTNQADFYWYASSTVYAIFNEGTATIDLTDVDLDLDDNADLNFGSDDDFSMESDTANTLEILPATAGNDIKIGIAAGTSSADLYWYSDTSGDYVLFDEENVDLDLIDVDLDLDDDSYLRFGTSDDITVKYDGSGNDLDILGAGLEIAFGATGDAPDIYIHSENAGDNVLFDEDNSKATFTDYDIHLDDDADLILGTGSDFAIDSDTAKTIEVIPAAATDDYTFNLGIDQSGVDLKIFGATTGEYWLYDASADSVLANTGNYLYTATDAEANQFKVDATGTVGGIAIQLETTDGGVHVNADGSANGDITLDAADDITLTHAGSLLVGKILHQLYVTVYAANASLTAVQSGGVIMTTAAGGSQIFSLPTAAAGLCYTFIDIGQTAGDDLIIAPASGDSIRGAAVGKYITSHTDDVPSSITLVAVNAGSWMVTSEEGTWAELAIP
jgi:hypothetical protein